MLWGLRALTPCVPLCWHALQGAAAGPLHPRAGALPLDPKWVLSRGAWLTHMPLVCQDFYITHAAGSNHVLFGAGLFAGGILIYEFLIYNRLIIVIYSLQQSNA
jgi:hypothetical protein